VANFNLDDYVLVNERIEKFYEKFPGGSIQTEVKRLKDGFVLIKAYAYRSPEDTIPATGHAYEKEGVGYVNKTSYIENCETSAVGRALAMMGFEINKSIASREEMEKVKRMEEDEKKLITESQIKTLEKKIKDTGADKDKLFKYYKVKSIKEMTRVQYSAAIQLLEKKKEKGK